MITLGETAGGFEPNKPQYGCPVKVDVKSVGKENSESASEIAPGTLTM